MAGPSIAVRVLGDLKGLGSAVDGAAKQAQSAGSRIHGAFSTVLGKLNASGVLGPFGGALVAADEGLTRLSGHGKDLGKTMMEGGGILLGLGTALTAFGSHEKASHQQLQAAVKATGHSYEVYAGRIDGAIKHQERFGNSSAETQDALRILTQATHDPAKALEYLGTASDLAAAKHESLSTAASQLGRTYGGSSKLLKEFGVNTGHTNKTVADHEAAIKRLSGVLQGQAAASTNTFTGRLKAMGTVVEDQVAMFGAKYGPAVTAAGAALTALGGITEAASAGFKALKTAELGEVGASIAAAAPILLIVAALAILGVAIYELVKHWNTVFAAMKKAAQVVWNWIKANWPLLVGILLGPVALAAALIYKNFGTIKKAALAVWTWIKGAWSTVRSALELPIRLAVSLIRLQFNLVKTAVLSVLGWIRGAWNAVKSVIEAPIRAGIDAAKTIISGLVGFFTGIPGHIASAFSGIGSAITGPIRGAIDGARRIIEEFVSFVQGIPGRIGGLIGGAVGKVTGLIHKIPGLQSGGYITHTGLIYAHAGETVIPNLRGYAGGAAAVAPGAPRAGPAVVVENAHFSTELDIDLFMKRAAWAVKRATV